MSAQDATSHAELESALASYKTAQADIVAINGNGTISLNLSNGQRRLGYTQIVAPMDGSNCRDR